MRAAGTRADVLYQPRVYARFPRSVVSADAAPHSSHCEPAHRIRRLVGGIVQPAARRIKVTLLSRLLAAKRVARQLKAPSGVAAEVPLGTANVVDPRSVPVAARRKPTRPTWGIGRAGLFAIPSQRVPSRQLSRQAFRASPTA